MWWNVHTEYLPWWNWVEPMVRSVVIVCSPRSGLWVQRVKSTWGVNLDDIGVRSRPQHTWSTPVTLVIAETTVARNWVSWHTVIQWYTSLTHTTLLKHINRIQASFIEDQLLELGNLVCIFWQCNNVNPLQPMMDLELGW